MDYRRKSSRLQFPSRHAHAIADHWQDVFVGSLLGIVMSYFAYRQYYPALSSELSHRPFSPRIRREEPETLPMHIVNGSAGGHGRRYSEEDQTEAHLGRSETVKRPGPGPLRDVWREGESPNGSVEGLTREVPATVP